MGDHAHHDHSQHMLMNSTDGYGLLANTTLDPHAGMDHTNHGNGGGHGGMVFHGGHHETVLFFFWSFDSFGGLFASCVALFLLGALYEALKVYRERWLVEDLQVPQCMRKHARDGAAFPSNQSNGDLISDSRSNDQSEAKVMIVENRAEAMHMCTCGSKSKRRRSPFTWGHVFQTTLQMIQLTFAYMLMLVFMTYNSWLCLSVILGAGCGYFIFGYRRYLIPDIGEDCH